MKKNLLLGFMMLTITSLAQFPEPTNLEFGYDYIMLDEWGMCAGVSVQGPTYCSHFEWITPDTSTTSSNLKYYKLYYFDYYSLDTIILASVYETYYEVEWGVTGEVWVTAFYSNPEGESERSNIIINRYLPISVNENDLVEENKILYSRENQLISIKNPSNIIRMSIIDIQGKLVRSLCLSKNTISIEDLPSGLYIIELVTNNSERIREKVIK